MGPVPPGVPSLIPAIACGAFAVPPARPSGEPEPAMLILDVGPRPVFDPGMPGAPLWPRSIFETAGPLVLLIGLVMLPRRMGLGFALLLAIEAACAC